MNERINRRDLGAQKEQLAVRFLESLGFRIIARNYRIRSGEIDLIAMEDETLCFVEVKYRSGFGYGSPAEAVDARKQQHILQVSRHYLLGCREAYSYIRYDVVEIVGNQIRILRNAFGGDY